ncbi:ABC transporter permease [Microbacterium sp. E-13]|uniref:ABC transporter permease n=1 Tax=Microbacterium sp. E-13 TaxID=3404048 RepID=UPI003CF87EE3
MTTTSSGEVSVAAGALTPRRARPWAQLRLWGPIAIVPILVAVFTALNPRFLYPENLLNIVSAASVLMVLAVAQTFVILMGSIDLSVGSVVTLTGVVGALAVEEHGAVGLLAVPLIGLAAGAINGTLFAYVKLPSFLVTLGTLYAFNGVSLFISNGASTPLPVGAPLAGVFSGTTLGLPTIFLWALIVLILAIIVLRFTRFGRFTYVLGGGEAVGRLSGVPVQWQKFRVFLLAGVLASFGGMLLMFRINGSGPDMGESFLLPTIAAVVMGGTPLTGGVGGPLRTVLGVLIITILTNGMTLANVHPFLQIVIQGVVVIVAVAISMDRSRVGLIK